VLQLGGEKADRSDMTTRARAAAPLRVWALIALAGLASTLSFTAVHGSRTGCMGAGVAELVSILGIAGLGLAVTSLLAVGAVSRYRALLPVFAAATALSLSAYAIVTLLAQDGAACAV
jgi:hypothetical protein